MQSFQAPSRILMGPGPSDVSERVLKALSQQTVGHLDPTFITLMDEIKSLLQFEYDLTPPDLEAEFVCPKRLSLLHRLASI